jgi:DNA-directed RNA polymerase specialized sigma24 family protein
VSLPKNKTEEEFLKIVDTIAQKLAKKFQFGYFTKEDIHQQIYVFALMGLEDYDETRPLENFLFSHIKNRLINYKRDKFKRTDAPCQLCYGKILGHTEHPDGKFCEKFLVWEKRNIRKQNVILPLDITNISDEEESNTRYESSTLRDLEKKEMLLKIDKKLPSEFRATYLQMREGVHVPKSKRLEIENLIRTILGDDLDA